MFFSALIFLVTATCGIGENQGPIHSISMTSFDGNTDRASIGSGTSGAMKLGGAHSSYDHDTFNSDRFKLGAGVAPSHAPTSNALYPPPNNHVPPAPPAQSHGGSHGGLPVGGQTAPGGSSSPAGGLSVGGQAPGGISVGGDSPTNSNPPAPVDHNGVISGSNQHGNAMGSNAIVMEYPVDAAANIGFPPPGGVYPNHNAGSQNSPGQTPPGVHGGGPPQGNGDLPTNGPHNPAELGFDPNRVPVSNNNYPPAFGNAAHQPGQPNSAAHGQVPNGAAHHRQVPGAGQVSAGHGQPSAGGQGQPPNQAPPHGAPPQGTPHQPANNQPPPQQPHGSSPGGQPPQAVPPSQHQPLQSPPSPQQPAGGNPAPQRTPSSIANLQHFAWFQRHNRTVADAARRPPTPPGSENNATRGCYVLGMKQVPKENETVRLGSYVHQCINKELVQVRCLNWRNEEFSPGQEWTEMTHHFRCEWKVGRGDARAVITPIFKVNNGKFESLDFTNGVGMKGQTTAGRGNTAGTYNSGATSGGDANQKFVTNNFSGKFHVGAKNPQ